jgi:hypothetical protein
MCIGPGAMWRSGVRMRKSEEVYGRPEVGERKGVEVTWYPSMAHSVALSTWSNY